MSRSNPNPYRPRHSHPTNGLSLIPQHVLNPVTLTPPMTRPAVDPYKAFTARDLDSFVDNIKNKIRNALLGPNNLTRTTDAQPTYTSQSTRTSDVFGQLQSVHIPTDPSSSQLHQPPVDPNQSYESDLHHHHEDDDVSDSIEPSIAQIERDQPILISSPIDSPSSPLISPTTHHSSHSEEDLSESDLENSSDFNHQQNSAVDSSNEESSSGHQSQRSNRLTRFDHSSSHELDSDEAISIDQSTPSQSQQTSSGSEHLDKSPSSQLNDHEETEISISESIEVTSNSSSVIFPTHDSTANLWRSTPHLDHNTSSVCADQDDGGDDLDVPDDSDIDVPEADSEEGESTEYTEEEAEYTEEEAEVTGDEEETDVTEEEEDIVIDTQLDETGGDLALDETITRIESLEQAEEAPESPHETTTFVDPKSPSNKHSTNDDHIFAISDLGKDAQQPIIVPTATDHPLVDQLDDGPIIKNEHGGVGVDAKTEVDHPLADRLDDDLPVQDEHGGVGLDAKTEVDHPLADRLDDDLPVQDERECVGADVNHQPSSDCPPTIAIQLQPSDPEQSSFHPLEKKEDDSYTESLNNGELSMQPTSSTKNEEVNITMEVPSSPKAIITTEKDEVKNDEVITSSSFNALEPKSTSFNPTETKPIEDEEMVEDDNDLFEGDNDLRLHTLGVNQQLLLNQNEPNTQEQKHDRFSSIEQKVLNFLNNSIVDPNEVDPNEDEEGFVEKNGSQSGHSMIIEKSAPEPTGNEAQPIPVAGNVDQPMSPVGNEATPANEEKPTEIQQVSETDRASADPVVPLAIPEHPQLVSMTDGIAEQKSATDTALAQQITSGEVKEDDAAHVETNQPASGVMWGELSLKEILGGAETFMKQVDFFPLNNQSQSVEQNNSAGWSLALSADISIATKDAKSQFHSTVSLKLPQPPSPRQMFNLDDDLASIIEDTEVPKSGTNETQPIVTETQQVPKIVDAPIADGVPPLAIFQHPQLLSIANRVVEQKYSTDTTEQTSSVETEQGTLSHLAHVETVQPSSGVIWGELASPETPLGAETFMKEVNFSPLKSQSQPEEVNSTGWTTALTVDISLDHKDVNAELSTAPTVSLKLPQPPAVRQIFNLDDSTSIAEHITEDICQNLKPVQPHELEDFDMLASSINDGDSEVAPTFFKQNFVPGEENVQPECSNDEPSTLPCIEQEIRPEKNFQDPTPLVNTPLVNTPLVNTPLVNTPLVNDETVLPENHLDPSLQSSKVAILCCGGRIGPPSASRASDALMDDPDAVLAQSIGHESHVAILPCECHIDSPITSNNLLGDPDALLAQFLDPVDAQYSNTNYSRASTSPVASVIPTSAVTFAASPPMEMDDVTLMPTFAPQTPLTSTTRHRGTSSSESSERFMSRGSASLITYSAPSSVVSSETASVPASSAPPPPLQNASMGAPTEAVGLSNQIHRRSSVDSSTHAEPPSPSTSTRQRSAPITQEQVNAPGLPHVEVIEAVNPPQNNLPDPLRSPPLMNQHLISSVPQPIAISTSRTSSMVAYPPSPSFSTPLEGSSTTPGLGHQDPSPFGPRMQLPDPNAAPALVSIPEIDLPIASSSIERNSSDNFSAITQVATPPKIEQSILSTVPPASSPKKTDSSIKTNLQAVDQHEPSHVLPCSRPLSLDLPASLLDGTIIVPPSKHNVTDDQTDKNVHVSLENQSTEIATCSNHQKDISRISKESPLESAGGENKVPGQIASGIEGATYPLDVKPNLNAQADNTDQLVDHPVNDQPASTPEDAVVPSKNRSPPATTRNKRKRQNEPKDPSCRARSQDVEEEVEADDREKDRESQLREILRRRRTSNQWTTPRTVPEPESPKKKKEKPSDVKKKKNVVKRARSGSKSDMNSENEVASDAPTEVQLKETRIRSNPPRAAKRLSNVSHNLAPPGGPRSPSNMTPRSNSSRQFPSSPINHNTSEDSSNSIQPMEGDDRSLISAIARRSARAPQAASSSAVFPNGSVSVVVPSLKLEDRIPKLRLHQHNPKSAIILSHDDDGGNFEILKQSTSTTDDTESKPVVGRRRKSDMHEARQLPPSVPPVTRSHCHFIRLKFNNTNDNPTESTENSKKIINTFFIPQCATGNEEIKNKMKVLDIVEQDNLTVEEQSRGIRIGHDGKKHFLERFDEHCNYSLSLKEEFLDFSVDVETLNTLIELVGLSLIQEGQVEALLPEHYFERSHNINNNNNQELGNSRLSIRKRRRTHSFDSSSSLQPPKQRSRKSSPAFSIPQSLPNAPSPKLNKRKRSSHHLES